MYVRGMEPDITAVPDGPIADGAVVFSGCSSCHGSRRLRRRRPPALQRIGARSPSPHIEDQLNLVYTGSQAYKQAGLATYGDPNRAGGAHAPGSYNGSYMPQQGENAGGGLSDAQILAVVCHERYDISGASKLLDQQKWSDEFLKWCSPDLGDLRRLERRQPDLRHDPGCRHHPAAQHRRQVVRVTEQPAGRTTDVLVIGGGPAGAATALLAGAPRPRRHGGGAQARSPREDLR